MERQGTASVWLGNAPSESAMRDILHVAYTEDGDAVRSSFAAAIEADDNDPDFSEWTYRKEPTRNIRDLISPHSYGDQIIPQIIAKAGELTADPANAVIVWHHYEYDGNHPRISVDGISMVFVGTALFDVGP